MTEELDVITSGKSLTWSDTWIKALTQPSVETYEEIASDPNAGQRRAFSWVITCYLIGYIIYFIVASLLGVNALGVLEETFGSMFLVLICGVPITIFGSVLGLMINAGVSQLVAGLLGGTGSYDKLVYGFAAYHAPLSLIISLLSRFRWGTAWACRLRFTGCF